MLRVQGISVSRRQLLRLARELGIGAAAATAIPSYSDSSAATAPKIKPITISGLGDAELVDKINQLATLCFDGDARRQDAFAIRVLAAIHGAQGSPLAKPFQKSSKSNDQLRIEYYSKALRRDTTNPDDPGLPELQAFARLRDALDNAFLRTWSREGFPDAPDFDALENLQGDVGGGSTKFQFTNPLGGLSFDLEGYDPPATFIPSSPAFESAQTAAEMAEVYWLALLRDVSFTSFEAGSTDPSVAQALGDLNKFTWNTAAGVGPLTVERFARADLRTPNDRGRFGFEGVENGPYISQFLLRGTPDPAVGQTPAGGIVGFGSLRLNQRQRTVLMGRDYLFRLGTNAQMTEWLDVQNGSRNAIGTDVFDQVQRFIRNPRDGANYVHFDKIYQEYLIASCILISEIPRTGPTFTLKSVEQPDTGIVSEEKRAQLRANGGITSASMPISELVGVPPDILNGGNPYRTPKAPPSTVQAGFATFGITQIVTLLAESSTRAHKAGWYHKWAQRRLRPEEFGGRVHFSLAAQANGKDLRYSIDRQLLQSAAPGPNDPQILRLINQRCGSYLLPMAFPEGCPTHPAYPSGHATIAGASITMLKATFNETKTFADFDPRAAIYRPKRHVDAQGKPLPDDGTILEDTSFDPKAFTIGGELNKLASNITMFRCMAGVHWRSDEIQGLLLGEQVAISLLIEQSQPALDRDGAVTRLRTRFYREFRAEQDGPSQPFFRLTTFAGIPIHIADGRLFRVEEKSPLNLFDWKVGEEISLGELAAEILR